MAAPSILFIAKPISPNKAQMKSENPIVALVKGYILYSLNSYWKWNLGLLYGQHLCHDITNTQRMGSHIFLHQIILEKRRGKKKSLTFWNMNWCSNNCFSVYDQLPHAYSFYLATTWEINVRIMRACMFRHRKWNNNVKYYCYCNCGIQIKHFQKKKKKSSSSKSDL